MRVTRLAAAFALVVTVLLNVSRGHADDVYFFKSIDDIKVTKGRLPPKGEGQPDYTFWNGSHWSVRDRQSARRSICRVVLDGPGEAFAAFEESPETRPWIMRRIAIRAPSGKKVTGRLWLPDRDQKTESSAIHFEIDASEGNASQRENFLRLKLAHYRWLVAADLPGAAWFRHQTIDTLNALNPAKGWLVADVERQRLRSNGVRGVSDTFSFATGGHAIAENLQLDRALPQSNSVVETVAIDKIRGITVREFDWSAYVKGKTPKLDRLATAIPADQHAVFFPSFDNLMQVADHADRFGTPVFRAAEPRSDDAGVRRRYERQLCLPSSAVARLLGPKLIASVALTGGDPYLLMGSDVAILFEAKDGATLSTLINTRVALAGSEYKSAVAVSGKVGDVAYRGMRSPDRVVCSYVATLDNVVVVTNSLTQLERIVAVTSQKAPSLASLPEYTFFRDRYPLGDTNESGLLILSDATIRRWCGPKWRIADSRRVRAAAVMSELQSQHLDRMVKRVAQPVLVTAAYPLADAGEFSMTADGLRSSTYGRLDFLTPIAELDIKQVTENESRLYSVWRDGYQSNWSNFFDPIAVRFHLSADKLAVDTTVMPLIGSSEYFLIREISQGAAIASVAGDPHPESALHAAMAFNNESPLVRQYAGLVPPLGGKLKVDPLAWIGSSIAIYADRDPFWAEAAKAENQDRFMSDNLHRLPVGVWVDVRNGLKLTLFLTAVRAYIEQAGPGMTTWEIKEHHGVAYARVAPTREAIENSPPVASKIALYYVASGQGLTLSFREDVVQRAIDRSIARTKAAEKANTEKDNADKGGGNGAAPAVANDQPLTEVKWLGEHLGLRIDQSAMHIIDQYWDREQQSRMQELAFANLPILNEWRRLYPAEDPVALHERLWHRRLACPGGGEYRWNETWQTMESTVYGHPGEPKKGPTIAAGLRDIQSGSFGLTFEKDGLRARVELNRVPTGTAK